MVISKPSYLAISILVIQGNRKTKLQNKQNENGNKSKFGKEAMKEFIENMQQ